MVAVAIPDAGDGIARDMHHAIAAYGQRTLSEWRQAIDELEQRCRNTPASSDRDELRLMTEALRFAVKTFEQALVAPLQDRAPDAVSWLDVTTELARDERAGWELWAQVKAAAADELACGKTGAEVIEGYSASPWERAQHLALRNALADGLQPRNGLEWTLIDGMTQALTMQRYWLHKHALTESLDAQRVHHDTDKLQAWQPPRISDAQAVDRAAMMADRFHRQFLRLLKAYRDGRKLFASMTVLGGQVNVGEQQLISQPVRTNARPRRHRIIQKKGEA